MSLVEQTVRQLEGIVNSALASTTVGSSLGMAEVKSQVLASYASYKALEASATTLQQTFQETARSQSQTVMELKRQASWTKRLAIGTFLLAAGTLVLAIIAALPHL